MSEKALSVPRPTIYFLQMSGCSHCAATKPSVRAFKRRHPEIPIHEFDLTAIEWATQKWTPEVTPTFILLRGDGLKFKLEGQRSVKEIEEWVQKALSL